MIPSPLSGKRRGCTVLDAHGRCFSSSFPLVAFESERAAARPSEDRRWVVTSCRSTRRELLTSQSAPPCSASGASARNSEEVLKWFKASLYFYRTEKKFRFQSLRREGEAGLGRDQLTSAESGLEMEMTSCCADPTFWRRLISDFSFF